MDMIKVLKCMAFFMFISFGTFSAEIDKKEVLT
jgi:hypothetical protein